MYLYSSTVYIFFRLKATDPKPLQNPTIKEIAEKHKKSPGQVPLSLILAVHLNVYIYVFILRLFLSGFFNADCRLFRKALHQAESTKTFR